MVILLACVTNKNDNVRRMKNCGDLNLVKIERIFGEDISKIKIKIGINICNNKNQAKKPQT